MSRASRIVALGAAAAALFFAPSAFGAGAVVIPSGPFECTGPVDLDLVVVQDAGDGNGLSLRQGCTGRIGRIEVTTDFGDGIKIHDTNNDGNKANDAHDLVVDGGFVRCVGGSSGSTNHSDGIQAIGGQRITFRHLLINCAPNAPRADDNAQMFANGGGGGPDAVVCEGCVLGGDVAGGGGSSWGLNINGATGSGATDTLVCTARYPSNTIRVTAGNVNAGNEIIPANDPRCFQEPAPPPPPPPPDPPPPVCDQACVDAYESQVADLQTQVSALQASVDDLTATVAGQAAQLAAWLNWYAEAPG